ncbi:hypothetical protein LCGC14_1190700 [marine sediment metagenome]|uniref:ParB-like N-terminal domain-containing protein n=1 Tax=marine sediment metagenome TaxID=412755 RepID=A0A0F9LJG9_9ZZZZ|nr:hypothetical protein [archaeon]
MVEYCFANAITREVELSEIRVDPQKRFRKYSSANKSSIKHKALKSSMEKFGLINPITLLRNYELTAGFQRYNIALELDWKTIRCRIFLTEFTKLDEYLIEITENYARKDFSSFEFFTGVAMIKREYEKEHPEIMHGKSKKNQHSPSKDPKKNGGNKVASDATLEKDQVLSFIKEYHNFFGVAERTLRNYTRIGEAYLDNKFSKESIELFNKGKLTQTQLLETLRKLENKTIIQSRLRSLKKKPPVNTRSVIVKLSTRNKKYPRESTKTTKIRKSIIENFINSGKEIINQQKNEIFTCDSLVKHPERHIDTLSIGKEPLGLENNLLNITFEKPSTDDTCFNCPKATVLAIRCRSCGGYTRKVHCKIDFIENRHILRDPNLQQCERAGISP